MSCARKKKKKKKKKKSDNVASMAIIHFYHYYRKVVEMATGNEPVETRSPNERLHENTDNMALAHGYVMSK